MTVASNFSRFIAPSRGFAGTVAPSDRTIRIIEALVSGKEQADIARDESVSLGRVSLLYRLCQQHSLVK